MAMSPAYGGASQIFIVHSYELHAMAIGVRRSLFPCATLMIRCNNRRCVLPTSLDGTCLRP